MEMDFMALWRQLLIYNRWIDGPFVAIWLVSNLAFTRRRRKKNSANWSPHWNRSDSGKVPFLRVGSCRSGDISTVCVHTYSPFRLSIFDADNNRTTTVSRYDESSLGLLEPVSESGENARGGIMPIYYWSKIYLRRPEHVAFLSHIRGKTKQKKAFCC
jgi:hypothetical protein